MKVLEDLKNRIASIAAEVEAAMRPSTDVRLAGWGQFVDAQTHRHQIGSYGTCAAIATILIADPRRMINPRVSAQVKEFWRAGGGAGEKLRSQNVRLAFLVLCLANSTDPTLVEVRDQVVAELRARQLPNGAWGDWHHPAEPTQARSETTAWVCIALARFLASDAHAIRGAEYLLAEMTGAGATKRLSPIAVGAAIALLPSRSVTAELKDRALSLTRDLQVGDQENITFFDYVKSSQGQTRVARDYLCFPAFYPLSLLLRGLHAHASLLTLPGIALRRVELASTILMLVDDGRPYRLRGAKFAATVDQAMIGLSYENLLHSRSRWDGIASLFRPLRARASENVLIRVVLPIAFLAVAAATMEDPKTPLELANLSTGADLAAEKAWVESHQSLIRIIVAILLIFSATLPRSVWRFIRSKITG